MSHLLEDHPDWPKNAMTTPTPMRACKHGQLARSCNICELERELAAAREALAVRNKQLGVACMKHDLVHALACGYCLKEAQEARQRAEALAESYRKDAERMEFLHERCSVTFTFKRDDGTSAMIAGPTNLRAAIDAAIAEGKK